MSQSSSKRFFGTWPEGRRTIVVEKPVAVSRVTGKPITKPLVRATPHVEIGAVRSRKEEVGG